MQLNPSDPQVWLTRATIYSLRNDLPNARRACARLTRTADTLVALDLPAEIDSRNGRLVRQLRGIAVECSTTMSDCRWSLRLGIDPAERHGRTTGQRPGGAGVSTGGIAGDTRGQLQPGRIRRSADSERRYPEVISLLAGREAQDNLLLRLSIAGQAMGSTARHGAGQDMYAARVQAAQRDGDIVHLREQAIFALDVQHDSARALQIAAQKLGAAA